MPRIHCAQPLSAGQVHTLEGPAARHVQVLRLQPGDALVLFGDPLLGGEWDAEVLRMGRSTVEIQVVGHRLVERETARALHLVVGMPANERMDWLIEKATELGVASVQPLQTERTVVRLQGDRAERRQAHWQAIAVSACEQCGRNRVPLVHPVQSLGAWLSTLPHAGVSAGVLSLATGSRPWTDCLARDSTDWLLLVGPEGGWSPQEEAQILERGVQPVGLGARVLRTETAALAALAVL